MSTSNPNDPLDFDLGGLDASLSSKSQSQSNTSNVAPTIAPAPGVGGYLAKLKAKGGIIGAAASLLLVVAKFVGLFKILLIFLLKFPLLVTFGTMAASIWLEALRFGWPLAAGIVGMIFLHECGHAWAARRLGHRTSGMIFIPFMGAAVFTRGGGRSVVQDAFVGIMGPVFGAAVGCAFWVSYDITRSPIFLELASWTFAINLFNLLPTVPLDGGWIVPVFSPKFLAIGMVLLIGVGFYNPFALLLAALSVPRVIAGWKAAPATDAYFKAAPKDRVIYAALYIGLAAFLALGQHLAAGQLSVVSTHQVM